MIRSSTSADCARFAALACALSSSLAATPARAEPSSSARAIARSLFEEARSLLAEHRYAEACPKLAESMALDPAAGTQLNLAVCHEGEGKTATAWGEYNDALTQARRDRRPEREQFASERLRALTPRLALVTIGLAEGASVPGLEITWDGIPVGPAALGVKTPADPGVHTIAARAPGRVAWASEVRVDAAGETRHVDVPVLPVAEGASASESPVTGAAPVPARDAADAPSSGRRTAGYVLVGAGAASVVVGAIFGVRAVTTWHERNALCATGCTAEGAARGDEATTAAWIADVGIGLGLASAAVGTYLLVTSPATPRSQVTAAAASVHAMPVVDSRFAGLALTGGF